MKHKNQHSYESYGKAVKSSTHQISFFFVLIITFWIRNFLKQKKRDEEEVVGFGGGGDSCRSGSSIGRNNLSDGGCGDFDEGSDDDDLQIRESTTGGVLWVCYAFKGAPSSEYINVSRWLNHIKAFLRISIFKEMIGLWRGLDCANWIEPIYYILDDEYWDKDAQVCRLDRYSSVVLVLGRT
ncbi:hypothetical protein MKW98_001815 [Papaver atlanticum]|uniref:Uncharacterized protein n=1 Tax=Papaver atlanticum TaxID=357466 RepID=A0AAD4SC74_9MAGN|nr:hypothetical protein MKW98_001815 [Papaver atlanticum]